MPIPSSLSPRHSPAVARPSPSVLPVADAPQLSSEKVSGWCDTLDAAGAGDGLAEGALHLLVGELADAADRGDTLDPEQARKLLARSSFAGADPMLDRCILMLLPPEHHAPVMAAMCLHRTHETLGIRTPELGAHPDRRPAASGESPDAARAALGRVRANVEELAQADPAAFGRAATPAAAGSGFLLASPAIDYRRTIGSVAECARTWRVGGSMECAAVAFEYLADRGVRPLELVAAPAPGGQRVWGVLMQRRPCYTDNAAGPVGEHAGPLPPPDRWGAGALFVDPHGGALVWSEQVGDYLGQLGLPAGSPVSVAFGLDIGPW